MEREGRRTLNLWFNVKPFLWFNIKPFSQNGLTPYLQRQNGLTLNLLETTVSKWFKFKPFSWVATVCHHFAPHSPQNTTHWIVIHLNLNNINGLHHDLTPHYKPLKSQYNKRSKNSNTYKPLKSQYKNITTKSNTYKPLKSQYNKRSRNSMTCTVVFYQALLSQVESHSVTNWKI